MVKLQYQSKSQGTSVVHPVATSRRRVPPVKSSQIASTYHGQVHGTFGLDFSQRWLAHSSTRMAHICRPRPFTSARRQC